MNKLLRIVACGLVGMIWIWTISQLVVQHPHLKLSLLQYFPYFLMGFAVYEILQRPSQILGGGVINDVLGMASIVVLLFSSMLCTGAMLNFLHCVAVFGILLGVLSGRKLKRFFSRYWLALIGGMCYSIYLIHLPVLEVLATKTARFGLWLPYGFYLLLQSAVLIPCVLAPAFVFYLAVERPCMNKTWPSRLYASIRATFA